MKIGFDASRVTLVQAKTGVEHYAAQMLSWFARLEKEAQFLVYTPTRRDPALESLPHNFLVRTIPFPRLWTHIRFNVTLFFDKPDVVYIPSHTMPFFCPVPAIVAIHDVAYKYIPDSYGLLSRVYLDLIARYATSYAQAIVVISESTKNDLIKYYHCDPAKIFVTYLGHDITVEKKFLDSHRWDVIREKYHLDKPYLFYIGRIEEKKNCVQLIDAFYELLAKGHDLKLFLAGKPGYGYEKVMRRIAHYNIEDRVVTGYITEEEKRYLLSYAQAFVFIPLYEGFGIPVLEALAAGKKIVASDIPVFRELFHEVVRLVDPRDTQGIVRGIEEVLSDPVESAHMIAQRKKMVEHFSWERCAKKTLEIIKSQAEAAKKRSV